MYVGQRQRDARRVPVRGVALRDPDANPGYGHGGAGLLQPRREQNTADGGRSPPGAGRPPRVHERSLAGGPVWGRSVARPSASGWIGCRRSATGIGPRVRLISVNARIRSVRVSTGSSRPDGTRRTRGHAPRDRTDRRERERSGPSERTRSGIRFLSNGGRQPDRRSGCHRPNGRTASRSLPRQPRTALTAQGRRAGAYSRRGSRGSRGTPRRVARATGSTRT